MRLRQEEKRQQEETNRVKERKRKREKYAEKVSPDLGWVGADRAWNSFRSTKKATCVHAYLYIHGKPWPTRGDQRTCESWFSSFIMWVLRMTIRSSRLANKCSVCWASSLTPAVWTETSLCWWTLGEVKDSKCSASCAPFHRPECCSQLDWDPSVSDNCGSWGFYRTFFFFEMESFYIALTGLGLAVETRLAWNSQNPRAPASGMLGLKTCVTSFIESFKRTGPAW